MQANPEIAASIAEAMKSDANKDGKLSMDESPVSIQAFFIFIDANGDNAVDVNELRELFLASQASGNQKDSQPPKAQGDKRRPSKKFDK